MENTHIMITWMVFIFVDMYFGNMSPYLAGKYPDLKYGSRQITLTVGVFVCTVDVIFLAFCFNDHF